MVSCCSTPQKPGLNLFNLLFASLLLKPKQKVPATNTSIYGRRNIIGICLLGDIFQKRKINLGVVLYIFAIK